MGGEEVGEEEECDECDGCDDVVFVNLCGVIVIVSCL